MLSIAILGSGKGSNAQSIIDAIQAGRLNARVVCVISDVADAYILDRARQHNIPAEYVDCAPFKTKLDGDAEQRVIDTLRRYRADFIALAGFMRIVKGGLLREFQGRIVNIHHEVASDGKNGRLHFFLGKKLHIHCQPCISGMIDPYPVHVEQKSARGAPRHQMITLQNIRAVERGSHLHPPEGEGERAADMHRVA